MRCHYVPRFYLRNFEDHQNGGRIWVYDKNDFSIRMQGVNDTAVETDLYGEDSSLENIFGEIESSAKPVFDKWIKNPESFATTSQNDFQKATVFMAFQETRATRSIDSVKEIMNTGLDVVLEKIRSTAGNPETMQKEYYRYTNYCQGKGKPHNMSFAEFCAMCKDPRKDCTIEPNAKIALGHSLEITKHIAGEMEKLNWTLYIAKDNRFFITNDSPINIFLQVNDKKAIFAGIGRKNVEVSFPLSSKICIFMCRKKMPSIQYVGCQEVEEINRRTVARANRFIYSTYRSNRIKKLIQKCPVLYGQKKLDYEIIKKQLERGAKD
ncbi:MAG: DUF4238 domain-containing protein [Elusimicrobiota bacterium]